MPTSIYDADGKVQLTRLKILNLVIWKMNGIFQIQIFMILQYY